MTPRLLLAALGLLCFALPAHADGEVQKLITAADKARLDKYGETRKAALAEAKAGDPAEVRQLDALLTKPLVAFSDKDLTGNWKCRTIKAGGLGPLVIYGWFKCKVTDDGSGWRLEKVSGSQRTKGRFFDDGARNARSISAPSMSTAIRQSPMAAARKATRSAMPSATAPANGASNSRRPTTNRSSTSWNSNAELRLLDRHADHQGLTRTA